MYCSIKIQEKKKMKPKVKKREVLLGNIIEALYSEVEDLPVSEKTKSAMVAMMLGAKLKKKGRESPLTNSRLWVAPDKPGCTLKPTHGIAPLHSTFLWLVTASGKSPHWNR